MLYGLRQTMRYNPWGLNLSSDSQATRDLTCSRNIGAFNKISRGRAEVTISQPMSRATTCFGKCVRASSYAFMAVFNPGNLELFGV